MRATREGKRRTKLPGGFAALVRLQPPRAIIDDVEYENTRDMIDRLMASGALSKGQVLYLETQVQLVQAYEAARYAIDTSGISGLASLKYLLAESDLTASDLARLLGVHPSLGSKLLNGDRALTVEHIKKLATRFGVSPAMFID